MDTLSLSLICLGGGAIIIALFFLVLNIVDRNSMRGIYLTTLERGYRRHLNNLHTYENYEK